ncbi:MAG: hypothetical protein AB2809_20030, partial [Candidatus Thiodiazotropha sp.]
LETALKLGEIVRREFTRFYFLSHGFSIDPKRRCWTTAICMPSMGIKLMHSDLVVIDITIH